jgi:hypothetical protein
MIQNYLSAGFPCLYILSHEPERAVRALKNIDHEILVWDCVNGVNTTDNRIVSDSPDPIEAIKALTSERKNVLIALNLHMFFDSPELKQAIANGVNYWKSRSNCLIIISPVLILPPEIEKLIHVIGLSLPDKADMVHIQEELLVGLEGGEDIKVDPQSACAAVGLTELEAETAFALCLAEDGYYSQEKINEIKAQTIKKSGLMEIWEAENIEDVGGLSELKDWLINRSKAWLPGNEHLPKIRGILLVGVPGTGKSLVAKAIAKVFNRMLIRMNIGDLKGSLVGESERRAREATSIVDAMGKSVVVWDEIEKAIGSAKSSAHTGDTTASILGHFLTWMQESKADFIIAATANDIHSLPAEFIRRFDQIWFTDLPTMEERREIYQIMMKRYYKANNIGVSQYPGWSPTNDGEMERLMERFAGYTGAEIEKVIRESMFDGIETALARVVPLSKTMKEDLDHLRDWAKTRALRANSPEPVQQLDRRTLTLKA